MFEFRTILYSSERTEYVLRIKVSVGATLYYTYYDA